MLKLWTFQRLRQPFSPLTTDLIILPLAKVLVAILFWFGDKDFEIRVATDPVSVAE